MAIKKYSGSRTLDDLVTFVTDNMAEEEKEPTGPLELTADTFSTTIAKGVTFVKFYAPQCGHCKRLAPTWDELALKVHSSSTTKIAKVLTVCHHYIITIKATWSAIKATSSRVGGLHS